MDLNDVLQREELQAKIEEFVDSDIRPFLQQDGGDIEVVELKSDGILRVLLQGACSSCPSSIMTLQFGVQRRLTEQFPEVTGLELAGLASYLGPSCHDESPEPPETP